MTTISLPVHETDNGGVPELLEPLQEAFIDEVFAFESDFEEAITSRLPYFANLLGFQKLLVIGRQQSTKVDSQPGRGLTLDLLAVSDTGRRCVIELKIAQDKFSVSQAYVYAAQLRGDTVEVTCATYAQYLSRATESEVTPEEAAVELADFLEVDVKDLDATNLTDDPAVVVISPSVSSEEYNTAKALSDDGTVVAIVSVSVQVSNHQKFVVFGRFFPALEPSVDMKNARTFRRARNQADRSVVSNERREDLEMQILAQLVANDHDSKGVASKDLRVVTGQRPEFTAAINSLADSGLIERISVESGKRGRKPLINVITAEGLAAIEQRNATDNTLS